MLNNIKELEHLCKSVKILDMSLRLKKVCPVYWTYPITELKEICPTYFAVLFEFWNLRLTGGMECSQTDQCTFISFEHKNVKERGKIRERIGQIIFNVPHKTLASLCNIHMTFSLTPKSALPQ